MFGLFGVFFSIYFIAAKFVLVFCLFGGGGGGVLQILAVLDLCCWFEEQRKVFS